MTRRILVVGIGPGDPDQVTIEAIAAVRSADYVVVTEKDRPDGDPLAAARAALLDRHVRPTPRVVVVADPERDRDGGRTDATDGYERAVADWHAERAERYTRVLVDERGDAAFLVWGDPALYDSTIRVLAPVADAVGAELVVVPGVSSLSALAARHRIVLHGIGEPVHVTTGRRLADAVDAGERSIAVLLNRSLDELRSIDPTGWYVWWAANLGTPDERLVSGPLADVLPDLETARAEVKSAAGWVMDVYLLRRGRGS